MNRLAVRWGVESKMSVDRLEALDRLLDRFAHDASHPLVELKLANGDALCVGMGLERTVLTFVSGDGLPPYLISKGSSQRGNGLAFYYFDTWTEFEESNAVELEPGRAAARQFAQHGELSGGIDWVEV